MSRFGTANQAWPTLAYAYPPVNIWEDADNVYVEAELPGMEAGKGVGSLFRPCERH